MKEFIVSARKYRPSTFQSVVGQKSLTTTLKNAIATKKLAHAYLFCGPRGVGKTTCARIFAKTINCLTPTPEGEPCNTCESCKAFNEQRSYNIHELDAASNNSVEDIRSLIEQVRIPPQIGEYKVYIIDEVHMLSSNAFNAFLKTLEEPPRHAIFILATTEKHKILPTILSRCQIYDFSRISATDTVEHLQYVASQEGITVEPEALTVIAQKADGGMRDALSIFDQVVSFTGGNITYTGVIENLNVLDYEYYFRLTDYFLENSVKDCLLIFDEILNHGFDGQHFITGLSAHFRDLLVSKDPVTLPLLEVGAGIRDRYQQQAQRCQAKFLFKAMKLCNDCAMNYRTSQNKRFTVEVTLIQLSQLTEEADDVSHGRGPTLLIKPIFKKEVATQQPQQHAAQATERTETNVGSPGAVRTNPVPKAQQEKNKVPVIKAEELVFSINKIAEQATKPNQVAESACKDYGTNAKIDRAANDDRDYIVNETDLNYYWRDYAANLPAEEKATKARMANMKPVLLKGEHFEVVVDNRNVMEHINYFLPSIQEYMRTNLHNRKITMSIRVSEPTENIKAYNRVDRFAMMGKKNPELLKLTNLLGLELD